MAISSVTFNNNILIIISFLLFVFLITGTGVGRTGGEASGVTLVPV